MLPTSLLDNKTPIEKLFQNSPSYNLLRVFACHGFPQVRDFNQNRLDYISRPCVFLGYSLAHLGYKCIDKMGRVYISRHVQFEESIFPYSTKETIINIYFDANNSFADPTISS